MANLILGRKRMKKLKIIVPIVVALCVVIGAVCWWQLVKIPHDDAVRAFEKRAAAVEEKNKELEAAIADLKSVSDSGEKPYDEAVITEASTTAASAQEAEEKVPEIPKQTKEIIRASDKLNPDIDYSAQIEALKKAKTDFSNSIQQLKQVTKPEESFVITRLQTVDEITGIQAVTEDNDLNGMLNKAGGYTADVYFTSSNVDQSQVYISGNGDIVGKGTAGGGCVEVYASEDDAKKRNDYLTELDGSILDSGSHQIVGTCIVRTSHLLMASKQKALTEKVIDALIAVQNK